MCCFYNCTRKVISFLHSAFIIFWKSITCINVVFSINIYKILVMSPLTPIKVNVVRSSVLNVSWNVINRWYRLSLISFTNFVVFLWNHYKSFMCFARCFHAWIAHSTWGIMLHYHMIAVQEPTWKTIVLGMHMLHPDNASPFRRI